MSGSEKSVETDDAAPAPDRPRRRRRWLRRLVILLVLLLLLVGAAPYVLSTDTAVGLITAVVNDRIRGRIEIDELSLGWLSPIRVRGVRVTDRADREVLRVKSVSVAGSLASRIASGMRFDAIEIDSPRAVIYRTPEGGTSLAEALSPREPSPPKQEEPPSEPPKLKGRIVIRNASVVVVEPDGRRIELTEIASATDLDTLDRISGNADAHLTGGGAVAATYKLDGLTREGAPAIDKAVATVSVRTPEKIDLAALGAYLLPGQGLAGKLDVVADVSLDQAKPRSTFDVNVAALQAAGAGSQIVTPIDVRIKGSTSVADKAVSGNVGIESQCGTVTGSFQFVMPDKPVSVTGGDVFAAVLEGKPLRLPTFALDANGRIDMPKLVRAVPALLKVRPDVTVTAGELALSKVALRGGSDPGARGEITLKGLAARRGERDIRWGPVTVDLDAALVTGKGLAVRKANLDGQFGYLHAGGEPDQFTAKFQADLARLHDQLAGVFELPTMTVAGVAEGTFSGSVAPDSSVRAAFDSTLTSLAYRQGERKLDAKSASVAFAGGLVHTEGKDVCVEATMYSLNIEDEVQVTGTARFDASRGSLRADPRIKRCMLAAVGRIAEGLGFKQLKPLAGELTGTLTVERESAKSPWVSVGAFRAGRLGWDGNAVSEEDIRIGFSGVRADPASGELSVADANVTSDLATVTVTGLQVKPADGNRFNVAGKVDLTAEAAKCLAAAARFKGDPNAPPVTAGRFTWSGTAGSKGGVISFVGEGGATGFAVRVGDKTVSIEPLKLTQTARIDTAKETVQIQRFRVRSPDSNMLDLEATGFVRRYSAEPLLDITGKYKGDWRPLMVIAQAFAPAAKDVTLTGLTGSEFRLTGTPSRPKITPVFRDLHADAGVGWATAGYSGFSLGEARLPIALDGGTLKVLPVTTIDASGGKVRLGGTVDMRSQPPRLHLPRDLGLLEDVPVNREVADDLLSRFNPIFSQLVSLEGRITLKLQDANLPLGPEILKTGTAAGRLDLSKMKVQPGGLLAMLLGLGGLSTEKAQVMEVNGADFTVRDGAIRYDNFTMMFGESFDLRFRGAVRFDDKLDLAVSIPVRSALLRKFGVRGQVDEYARLLEGARVEFPILGTRLEPKPDLSRVDVRPLVQKAVQALMSEQAGKAIGDILKGRTDPKKPAPPTTKPAPKPTPTTKPAPKKPEDELIKGAFDLLNDLLKKRNKDK